MSLLVIVGSSTSSISSFTFRRSCLRDSSSTMFQCCLLISAAHRNCLASLFPIKLCLPGVICGSAQCCVNTLQRLDYPPGQDRVVRENGSRCASLSVVSEANSSSSSMSGLPVASTHTSSSKSTCSM